jgi:pilus assembly protein Flp/PilA
MMLMPFSRLAAFLRSRRGDQRGASAVEYGLLVAAIAAVIVVIVFALGGVVQEVFTDTCEGITTGAENVEAGCEGTP